MAATRASLVIGIAATALWLSVLVAFYANVSFAPEFISFAVGPGPSVVMALLAIAGIGLGLVARQSGATPSRWIPAVTVSALALVIEIAAFVAVAPMFQFSNAPIGR